jgi:hypothetical protein
MKLVDLKTHQLVEVPEAQAAQAFQSGAYGLDPSAPVHVTDADTGEIRPIDPTDVEDELASGARFSTGDEIRKFQKSEQYGGLAGGAIAGAEGLARGVSAGLSDPLAVGAARLIGGTKAADATREHLAGFQEENPYIAGAGQLVGTAGAMLVPGLGEARGVAGGLEAAEAARGFDSLATGIKALGAVPGTISKLGEGAEGLVSGMLGATSDTAIGKAAQSAAQQAVRNAVEGGLLSSGEQVSEDTLQNRPLTAEKIFTAVGHGALTGGLVGAGLGFGGSLGAQGVAAALGNAAHVLDSAVSKQALKWLDAGKRVVEGAEKRAGGAEAVGRTVFEKVFRPIAERDGVVAVANLDPAAKLSAVRKALDNQGSEISSLLEGNADASVKLSDMISPIDNRIREMAGTVGGENKVASLSQLRASVLRVLGGVEDSTDTAAVAGALDSSVSIADLVKQRRSLQQIAYQESKSLDPNLRVQLLRDISGEWNGLEETALNDASKDLGDGLDGARFRAMNKDYQRLKIAENALETNVSRWQTNRSLSLTDTLAGMPAMGAALMGHPLTALASPAMALGHRYLRQHGNAYAAIMLDRLATMGGMGAAVHTVDEGIDRAVSAAIASQAASRAQEEIPKALLEEGPVKLIGSEALRGREQAPVEDRFEEESERIRQLAATSASTMNDHLQSQTIGMSAHAPDIAQSIHKLTSIATSFLASKLPKVQPPEGFLPGQKPLPVSGPEQKKFLRYVDAVEDGPVGILKTPTPEGLEVLHSVYPSSAAEIKTKILARLMDTKHPVDYQTRLRLSQIMGAPADGTQDPGFVQRMQVQNQAATAAHAAQQQPTQGKNNPRVSNTKLGDRMQSAFDGSLSGD